MNKESKHEDMEIRNIWKSRNVGYNNSRTATNQSKYNNSLSNPKSIAHRVLLYS
jgi:hypothetical protein